MELLVINGISIQMKVSLHNYMLVIKPDVQSELEESEENHQELKTKYELVKQANN